MGALSLGVLEGAWAAEPLEQPISETSESSPADGAGGQTAAEASGSRSPWEDFFPPPDSKFDWIQLTSDEWLKGDLKVLYNFKVEFKSDKLGLLTLDWEDIKRMRTAGPQAVRVEDLGKDGRPTTVFGVLTISEDAAIVGSGAEARQVNRDDIVSIATGTRREGDFWSGKVSLGANVRSGNSDLANANLIMNFKRRRAVSRTTIDYLGNFSRAEGVETQNNHRLSGNYDIFKTTKWFWRPITGEYFRDPFKNIAHQVALATGAGYHIKRTSKTEWELTGAVGGLYKRFVSVEPGDDIENVSPAVGLGTKFDTELTSRLDYLFDYSFQIVDKRSGTYLHHLITTLSSDIVGNLDLDLSVVWDRVQDPQAEADGTVPGQDDFQFIVGLGYEL